MSWYQHNGWPVEAIHLLGKADRLKKTLREAMEAKAADTPEIVALEKELADHRQAMSRIADKLLVLRDQVGGQHRKDLAHIQQEIETLANKAKELKKGVPEKVNQLIERMCRGVNYSAGFQIVWWNKHFVILRLAGGKFWSGVGMPWSYARAETKMYDLRKLEDLPAGCGTDIERACKVKAVEGKISAKKLQEWKEEAEYASA